MRSRPATTADGTGGKYTHPEHPALSSQLYAAYARAVQARVLASVVGEEGLSTTDRQYLAFGTSFERQYGVLKRLGTTPLGRPRLLTAKTLSIVAVEVVQVVVLVAISLAVNVRPLNTGMPSVRK